AGRRRRRQPARRLEPPAEPPVRPARPHGELRGRAGRAGADLHVGDDGPARRLPRGRRLRPGLRGLRGPRPLPPARAGGRPARGRRRPGHDVPPARREHAVGAALRGRAPRGREAPPADERPRTAAPPRAAGGRALGARPRRRRAPRRRPRAPGAAGPRPPPALRAAARGRRAPKMRIALLTEIPAPFRLPLFAALAREPDVDLRVFFLAANDPRRNYRPYPLEFPAEVLPGKDVLARGRWLVVNVGVLGRLRRFRPHVVLVGGWNQPAFWQALLYARAARVPLVVWVESTARDERAGRGPAEALKRAIVRSAAAFVVPGRAAEEYVRSL